MNQKILLIDVDGTLVNYAGKLPDSAVCAVRRARQNGHLAYICTGRSEAEIYDEIWDVGFDGMIGGNGAYVRSGDTVVLHRMLTSEQCRRVVDWLNGRKLDFYLECNSGLYGSEHFRKNASEVLMRYGGSKGMSGIRSTDDVFPTMIYGETLYRDDVNKVSFILSQYQDHLDSAEAFPDLLAGTWGGAGETALFGDLGVRGITKQSAVEALLNHLRKEQSDTIAFGDARIDIPMFEACGYSVAMGSGGPECREAADYVTEGVDQDGLFKAFAHLGII